MTQIPYQPTRNRLQAEAKILIFIPFLYIPLPRFNFSIKNINIPLLINDFLLGLCHSGLRAGTCLGGKAGPGYKHWIPAFAGMTVTGIN
ncbi:TPA: hypothetical protein DEP94_01395 [Candidatus Nomurabacteria bacterium]|nr:hypothetical protein [Candidatus Nomurabacteria bacterium]